MLPILSLPFYSFVLSSGSAVGAFCWKRKYEEFLPITCIGIVLVLFFFGFLNILEFGVYVVLALSLSGWIFAVYSLISQKRKL